MKKFLAVVFTVYLSLILFMPKVNIWFTLEKALREEGVIISDEKVKDYGLFFSLKDGKLYYDGLKTLDIGSVKVLPFLFFNEITLKNIKSSKETKSLFNLSLSEVDLKNSVLKPFSILIKGEGDMGKFSGSLDLKKRFVKIVLIPSKKFLAGGNLRRYFKKSKEGYVYEYGF